jgi:hypothetical protein
MATSDPNPYESPRYAGPLGYETPGQGRWPHDELATSHSALVRIASFITPEEAAMARAALEAEGIPACLDGAATAGNLWHVGLALGGVRLLVMDQHVESALKILEQREHPAADRQRAAAPRSCPHCGIAAEPGFAVCWSCGEDLN